MTPAIGRFFVDGEDAAGAPPAVVLSVTPLRTLVSASWAQPRFAASVVSGFALLAIGLAGIGLYGALSYSVSQRRRELGVRAALGATRGALVRLVLREGVSVTLAGWVSASLRRVC